MTWLRLNTLSVGSLTTTILLGLITGYLLSLKRKRRDTWYLSGYLGTLFVLLLSYTIRYSLLSPVGLITGQFSNLIVFGVLCLIQFAYHYGKNYHPRESRIVLYLYLTVSLVIWGSLFFVRDMSAVYDFKGEYFTYEFGPRISILTLVGLCWALFVLVRKIVCSSQEAESPGKAGVSNHRSNALRILLYPSGRIAASSRSFAVLTLAFIVIAILYLLFQTGAITRATYALIFNSGALLICLLIFIVYVNNAPQPTSYLTKLVGIPLAVIMVVIGITAGALMPIVHGTLADRYRGGVDQAWIALLNRDSRGLSPNIAFILPSSGSSGSISFQDPFTVETEEALLVDTPGVEGLLPERRGLTPRFFYLDLLDYDSFYFFYTLEHRDVSYRVGFHYRDYRLAIHKFASKFLFVVLLTTLLVVLGFPLIFRRGLLKPLGDLLEAVRQVSAGNYHMSVPVSSEDEIGQLAREYNHMVASLRNAEGNFKALAENANDAILILSEEGRVLYANLHATEISGYSAVQLRRMHFSDVVHPEELSVVTRSFAERMAGGATPRCYETQIIHRDGIVTPIEITGARTIWHNEAADVIIIRDVFERKQAEELVRSQQQQLLRTDKLASLGALVAGVVHEINNPNQVISMNTRFLSEGLPRLFTIAESGEEADDSILLAGMPYVEFKEATHSAVSEIEESTGRIEHIVSELKRFVVGGSDGNKESTDVNRVVRTVVELSRHLIGKATRRFDLDLEEDIPQVQGNRIGLEQVVLNLLLNACQALPDRDRRILISTYYDEPARAVCIEVLDEGIGIPEQDLARITDPFFTTRSESGGTGLGLSVSNRIVRRHEGTLLFSSEEGRGTTATVRLPIPG